MAGGSELAGSAGGAAWLGLSSILGREEEEEEEVPASVAAGSSGVGVSRWWVTSLLLLAIAADRGSSCFSSPLATPAGCCC